MAKSNGKKQLTAQEEQDFADAFVQKVVISPESLRYNLKDKKGDGRLREGTIHLLPPGRAPQTAQVIHGFTEAELKLVAPALARSRLVATEKAQEHAVAEAKAAITKANRQRLLESFPDEKDRIAEIARLETALKKSQEGSRRAHDQVEMLQNALRAKEGHYESEGTDLVNAYAEEVNLHHKRRQIGPRRLALFTVGAVVVGLLIGRL